MRQAEHRGRRLGWGTMVFAAVLAAGCGEDSALQVIEDEPALDSDMVPVPPAVLAGSPRRSIFATGQATVLYLNFDGATITRASNKSDAVKNVSFIGGGTIPAFNGDQSAREQVVALVKQLYADFNIKIVTSRPSSGDYDMTVIGGSPSDLGLNMGNGVVGIAPMDCRNELPRDVSFVFSGRLLAIVGQAQFIQRTAEATAHESAHSYGLPHSNDGCDLMSYATCAKLKTFLNQTMAMQSDSQGTCGMSSMNSHALLLAELGAAPPPDIETPKVTISSPADGATVTAGTQLKITAKATDNIAVTQVQLLIDSVSVGTRSESPYEFDATLAAGAHTLTVTATDAAGNKGQASIQLTARTEPAPAPDSGTSGGTQDPGTPKPGTPKPDSGPGTQAPGTDLSPSTSGAYGATCHYSSDCQSGLCALETSTNTRFCTQTCDEHPGSCPGEAICHLSSAGASLCGPAGETGAQKLAEDSTLMGGCSAAGRPAAEGLCAGVLFLFALVLQLVARSASPRLVLLQRARRR